jgi:murein DD-endopeptidase MepM/ murein hydrolase activator NlpD
MHAILANLVYNLYFWSFGQSRLCMNEHAFIILYKLRYLLGAVLIAFSVLLLAVILSITSGNYTVQAKSNSPGLDNTVSSFDNNPNVITAGMDAGLSKFAQMNASANKTLSNSLRGVTSSMAATTSHGSKIIGHGVYSGVITTTHGITKSFAFMIHTPGNILGHISNTNVSSIIKPAETDHSSVPTISPGAITASAAKSTAPPAKAANQAAASTEPKAVWPIHGIITTQFGVPELPYQAIHTGLDISDGKRSGTTPIKPFKPGRVAEVVRSSSGLGNHVIIDHGGGMTSVYGHLYSITVTVGQVVDQGTTIGYEGSTGASTGTHLHFEIRINGQPVNPHQFISGQP